MKLMCTKFSIVYAHINVSFIIPCIRFFFFLRLIQMHKVIKFEYNKKVVTEVKVLWCLSMCVLLGLLQQPNFKTDVGWLMFNKELSNSSGKWVEACFNQLIHIFLTKPLISISHWRLHTHLGYNNNALVQFCNKKCSLVKLFMTFIRSQCLFLLFIFHFAQ